MVSLTDVINWLSALSSIALIFGAIFVIFQLRQNNALLTLNTKLVETTLRQERADVAIALLEHLTDHSFPRRRWRMHEIVKQFVATGWKDAFESEEDFEVRHFVQIYELIGTMARRNVIDVQLVIDSLHYQVVRDWEVFQPHLKVLAARYGAGPEYFESFRWLATESSKRFPAAAATVATPLVPSPSTP